MQLGHADLSVTAKHYARWCGADDEYREPMHLRDGEIPADLLARIAGQYELLFYGVDLTQYGRADYDQMLANVADLPPGERRRLMLAGLNELVASIQLGVKQGHGAQEEAVVSGIIKEAYRRLGVP